MDREIKTKAFSKSEKKFTTEHGISLAALMTQQPLSVEQVEDLVFVQCTGLKDKNGVEIYEGDIVKWDDSSKGKYWRVAEVEIAPSLNFHSFDCPLIDNSSAHGHRFHYGNFIYKDTHNHLEIIGNIHENPELLEVKS